MVDLRTKPIPERSVVETKTDVASVPAPSSSTETVGTQDVKTEDNATNVVVVSKNDETL